MAVFAEQLLKGLGAAGWLIGFIAALGLFLILVGVIGYAAVTLAGVMDAADEKKEDNTHVDPDH